MIVVLMDQDRIHIISSSRLYSLLLLIFILFFSSCNRERIDDTLKKENTKSKEIRSDNELSKTDSISISMDLGSKRKTALKISDKFMHSNMLKFHNKTSKDTVIVKKIERTHKNQIISYTAYVYKNEKIQYKNQNYFVNKDMVNLDFNFDFDSGDIELKNKEQAIQVDTIYQDYRQLASKIYKNENKQILEKELNDLFERYKERYSSNKKEVLLRINELHYIDKLQQIFPLDDRIDVYLKELKTPIASDLLNSIIYRYVKNRIHSFDFDSLHTQNYSQEYIQLLSIGIFNYLRNIENEGSDSFQVAYLWLRATKLYQKNKDEIERNITRIDRDLFTKKLKKLDLLDISFHKTSFPDIIERNPSDYYLLDFWATWCAPCIKGFKVMDTMVLPKNIKVISLSVDMMEIQNKWKIKTEELNLDITYLINATLENGEFIKMMELNSIPRYVVIDKDFNLIHADFLHPSEPDFLKKLKEIKYHTIISR